MSKVGGRCARAPERARDGRRRSRRSRTPGSRPRARRSSSPRPWSPPSHPRRARSPGGRAALRTDPGRGGGQRLERRGVQTDEQPPVVDRDGRRHGAIGLADRRLGRRRDLDVLRIRQAVADQRRLERDDRGAVGQRGGDLRREDEAIVSRRARWACPQAYRRRYPAAHGRERSRPMTPRDLRASSWSRSSTCRPMAASPIVVRRSSKGDRYHGHLVAIAWGRAGRRPTATRLTRGAVRDTWPRISPTATPSPSSAPDPGDEAPPGWPRPRSSAARPARRAAGYGAVGEVAWSPDGRRLAFTAEVDPPRFLVGRSRRSARDPGRTPAADTLAARPTDHPDRLALGREGHRDRWSHLFVIDKRRGAASPGHAWRLGRHRTSRGTPTAGPSPSPPTAVRSPTPRPRTTIWAVDVDAAGTEAAEPREVLAPVAGRTTRRSRRTVGGWRPSASSSPSRSTT